MVSSIQEDVEARGDTDSTLAPSRACAPRGVRAAVIGSGFGGLACAIRLQAAGIDTTLFEARDQPGGRAYVYRDRGFTFDAGPTVITAPDCLEELFALFGKRSADYYTLVGVDPFYRLRWPDGSSFDYVGDERRLLEQIARFNPSDVDGYRRFADYARRVFDKGYTELAATPFLRLSDMVRVAPHLAWLRADRSVYTTISRYIQDEKLRQAFSFHSLLVGGNPFETSSIYTLIHHLERHWGVYFPLGGTGALVDGLVRLFVESGGKLRLNAKIDRITPIAGRRTRHHLHVVNGDEETFDLVVSNADLHHTYARLYGECRPAAATAQRLRKMRWSMSLFVLYFGVERRYEHVAHHTILFGPRYRGLLDDIFHGQHLADDFSLYLHAPSVTDPSMAPPGCEAFYVLSPVPHLGNAAIDWNSAGPRYADRILESLEEYLPELRSKLVVRRMMTPLDFQSQLGAYHGSAFSVAPTLRQSAYFRPHNRDRKIPGLYLVGAGTHPGAGIPGVVNSAKATATVIIEDVTP